MSTAILAGLMLPAVPATAAPALSGAGTALTSAGTAAHAVGGLRVSAPLAAKKSSWKASRTEEFSGSDMPSGCEAYSGKDDSGKSAWSSKNATLSGGLLTLSLEKRKTSGKPYRSGGVGCWGWAQKYGKYEIRAKVPAGKGIDSFIALMPVKGGDDDWTGIDLLTPGPETAYVTNGYGTTSEGSTETGDYSGKFRDYVIEWAPKHVRMTVDDEEIFYSTRSYKGSRWLSLVTSTGDKITGVPDADTKLPAKFQIDRVKISTYTGVAPKARSDSALALSRARVAGVPTPGPSQAVTTTTAPEKGQVNPPAARPTTALNSAPTASTQPALAGGVWPWLLGGSLIALFAVVTLNYPNVRRKRSAETGD